MATRSQPNLPCRSMGDLTPACRQLVETMSMVGFGRFENLRIVAGQPDLDSPLLLIQEIRFGSDRGTSQPTSADFEFKAQVVELIMLFSEIRDGVIRLLVFKNGLPFKVEFDVPSAAKEGRLS